MAQLRCLLQHVALTSDMQQVRISHMFCAAAFMYVLVPMPYLFFGTGSSSSASIYGGSSMASGCVLCKDGWQMHGLTLHMCVFVQEVAGSVLT